LPFCSSFSPSVRVLGLCAASGDTPETRNRSGNKEHVHRHFVKYFVA
jgi:hypothetical protein